MQGTSLTKQERECKLYDAFDKFTHIKGESLHKYYLRFTQLINDMSIYNMKMEQFQLHAYLEQHKLHANEARLLRERNQDPLAFVVNQQMTPPHFNTYQSSYNNPQLQQQFSPSQYGLIHPTQHYSLTYPSQPQFNHSSVQPSYPYQSQMNHQTSSIPQRDDLIACLNKAMAFLIVVASSRVILLVLGETIQVDMQGLLNATTVKVKDIWLGNALSLSDQGMQHDPGVPNGQAVQTIILNNAAFQTEDIDTYDFDCDDISNA
ncbi:hypothetical protein Tco_0204054 [Tanacetum coccineum]